MYYCDCDQSRKGHKTKYKFIQVEVTSEGICTHCGHYAFYSRLSPAEAGGWGMRKALETEEKWIVQQRLSQ